MILIVEGMDNCGKTTLIDNLRKKYFTRAKTIVHHSSSPPKDIKHPDLWESRHYDDLSYTFKELVRYHQYDVILDRFHLGAIVYGAKYRQSDGNLIRAIDKQHFTDNKESALLLLTDTYEGIKSRDDGKSIEQTKEEFDDVRNRFIKAFEASAVPNKLHIEIGTNTIDMVYQLVIEWLIHTESYLDNDDRPSY